MLFHERTKIALEKLSKQKPLTYEQMKAQILRVKMQSESNKNRKHKPKQPK